jgi:A/G-specific adenine glycosylase
MLGLPTTAWAANPLSEAEALAAVPADGDWRKLGEIDHIFTHFALTLAVYEAESLMDAEWTDDLSVLPSVFLKAARLSTTAGVAVVGGKRTRWSSG